ncbi:MAG: hypothetical protein J5610_03800 [Prevotella sp.]|nr:hypothetical protein [Prevotella sp.]
MKKNYVTPQVEIVKIKPFHALLIVSDPEQAGTGDDGQDGEGLARSFNFYDDWDDSADSPPNGSSAFYTPEW